MSLSALLSETVLVDLGKYLGILLLDLLYIASKKHKTTLVQLSYLSSKLCTKKKEKKNLKF